MSWSFSSGPHKAAEFEKHLKEDAAKTIENNAHLGEHGVEQIKHAVEAAVGTVKSGVVGGEHHFFHVTMSGHANPNHEPAPGWANDVVSIHVSQSQNPDPTPPPAA